MYVRGKGNNDHRCMISRVKIACYKRRNVSQAFIASHKQGVFDGCVELDTHADATVH